MPDPFIPTPPEGYLALANVHEKRHIDQRQRRPSIHGTRQPLPGVLVYAERQWLPVLDLDATRGRKVEVTYTGSKLPGAGSDGRYMQRVPAERIAVDPLVHPRLVEVREHAEAAGAAQAARMAEYEAGREARDAERRAAREEIRAETEAKRAAELAAMPAQQRLAVVRRQLAVAQEMIEARREAVEAAQGAGTDDELREALRAALTDDVIVPIERGPVLDALLSDPGVLAAMRHREQQAEERGYERGRRDYQFAPEGDNHHNAALCPYCSPAASLDPNGRPDQ